jgi:hypothetical protein
MTYSCISGLRIMTSFFKNNVQISLFMHIKMLHWHRSDPLAGQLCDEGLHSEGRLGNGSS